MLPYKNYIYEYHAKIKSGEIVAGKWIKAIYKIIVDGLEKQEYFFNAKAANKAIKFIENFCHHSKGRSDLIKLELWQKAIISVIFGIQDAEKVRVFREIFIVIGASGVHFPLDVFQLAVAFGVDHQVVPLQAGIVDDIVAVIDASAVGGMGVVDAHAQAVVGVGGLISLPVRAFHQTVRLVVDVLPAFLLPGFRDAGKAL